MSDEICRCGHPLSDHVRAQVKPGGVDGQTTEHVQICTRCLCQAFEPDEAEAEE